MADTSVLDAASACLLACLAQHGLALLPPGWLPPDLLDALRAEAAGVLEQAEAAAMACEEAAVASCAVQKHGCVFQVLPELLGAGHAARADAAAYWRLRSAWPCRPEAAALLHCDALRQLLAAALGSSSVLLFNEQYIIKLPAGGTHTAGSAFAWHYDSHWCRGARYSPYLSLWVALDDMTHDNGGLVVLPWSSVGASGGGREQGAAVRAPPHCASGQAQFAQFDSSEQLQRLLARQQLQEGCDSDSVEPLGLQMRAGSAVLMWDNVWHCSGPNRTRHTRAAYMAHFSSRPLMWADSGQLVGLAVPL